MSPLEISIRLAAGIFLILANAFFVCIEFALTRLRQFEFSELPDTPGVKRCWDLTKELEINLTGCQVGISLTSILLGVVAEPAVTEMMTPLFHWFGADSTEYKWVGVGLSIVVLNLVHKIWGEQSPTYLGVEKPVEVCSALGIPFSWWTKLVYPVIIFGDGLAKWTLGLFGVTMERSWTDDDEASTTQREPRSGLRSSLIKLMKKEGVSKDRVAEVTNTLDIGSTPISDILVPREKIVALSTEDNLEINLSKMTSHSRYPIVGKDLDDFKGCLYIPEVLSRLDQLREGSKTLQDLCRGRLILSEDMMVADAIDRFQSEYQEIALVQDREGVIVGLLTLTDAFERIVGQAEDPLDLEERYTESGSLAAG
jgi:CBS domain containing-hemolysin-like protein